MEPIRVMIVDDSPIARGLIRAILEGDPGIEVVGEAADGRAAVEMAARLKPQLVTMDLEMPVMGGMEAIAEIMCSRAVPILVVSSRADSANAYQAISRGALEVMPKPDVTPETARAFVEKVRMLAGIRVITHIRPPLHTQNRLPLPGPAATPAPAASAAALPRREIEMVAIASSTGGPQALAAILQALPAAFPIPIVIAQHIADGFAPDMARWLDGLAPLSVQLAAEGVLPAAGRVYLSPSERHLVVTPNRRLSLVARGTSDIYKPSCDRLLGSVAEVFGRRSLGIILTGMGRDGVVGMQAIRTQGGVTLAQDEASSVIYGMNGQAVKAGAVERELPLSRIAEAIVDLTGANR